MGGQGGGRSRLGGARIILRLVLIATLLAIVVVFALINSQRVTVDFLFDEQRMRLGFALLIAGGLGVLVGLLFSFNMRR